MSSTIRPMTVDIILLISIIILIINSIKISKNFFNFIFDRKFLTRIDILYLIIYVVYILGISPTRYIDLLKISYKTLSIILKHVTDSNNILLYSTVLNILLIIAIQIILITQPFTKRILITLGILSAIQVCTRVLWGYKILSNRFTDKHGYKKRMDNIKAIDVIIHQLAEADYNKFHTILKKTNTNISNISKLSEEERKKYILYQLFNIDLTKINLSNKDLEIVKKLQLHINMLNYKLKKLTDINTKHTNIVKCIKSEIS